MERSYLFSSEEPIGRLLFGALDGDAWGNGMPQDIKVSKNYTLSVVLLS